MDLWDLHQQRQIRNVSARAAAVGSQVDHHRRAARDGIEALEERIDRLALLCEALWELARDATGLTDEQLEARVRLLDGSDGEVDGRIQRQGTTCGCGAKIGPKARICVFCSAPAPARAPFEAV